jgi:DNA processing protein
VAEAARNSGALITADFALEQGREVFALPGKVDSNTSYGTNELIKQGAKLVSSVDDILEEFISYSGTKSQKVENQFQGKPEFNLGEEEDKVYALVSEESIQLDELVEKTNMDIPKISDILFRLQLKKLIKQVPGKQFIKS